MFVLGASISLRLGNPTMADAEAVWESDTELILPLMLGGQALYMSSSYTQKSADML